MKSFSSVCLLVWLVHIDASPSSQSLNATDSLPANGDERTNQLENEDSNPIILSPETGFDVEGPQFNYRPRKDSILNEWATRGLFSGRRNRRGMSPRSLFNKGRRLGYFGRYPSRFRRYAPAYGPYGRDQYTNDYPMYPQTYAGGPMYNQAAYAQTLPNGQQPEFSSRPQSPYGSTQLYPPAQPYYRDPYNMSPQQPQQPQQFAASSPYSPNSRINPQPQYYANRPGPQWANQQQSPMSQDPRYQPTGESFDQFGAPVQPSGERGSARSRTRPSAQGNRVPPAGTELQQLTDDRDGARSRTRPAQGNRDPLANPELQRTSGSLDQFRTEESGSPRPQENRRNGDQPIESERQLTGLNAPAAAGQTPAVAESAAGENRSSSGLLSFFRSLPATTTTTESSNPQSRSIADSEPKEAREQPGVGQVAPVAA